jgi:2,3-bisphosphoglycerate-independent phosphoglycerate mutase
MPRSDQPKAGELPFIKNLRHILLIFIDGIGIGEADVGKNPFARKDFTYFSHFLGERYPKFTGESGIVTGLDANLGIAGLPQSATGQTALLAGINGAQALGRHLNGYPDARLREIIAEHSILKTLKAQGNKVAFLNTFRPPFFDYDPFDIIRHLSVTTLSNLYAGLPFFTINDLLAERSIYQDMTNEALIEKGFDVPLYSPEKAGEIVAKQSQNYFFCLYEYFQTDFAGHSQDMQRGLAQVEKLDRFLYSVLTHAHLDSTLIILTSDHGNLEDLSVKGHTRNPVLTLLFGQGSQAVYPYLKSILDVTPLVLRLAADAEK